MSIELLTTTEAADRLGLTIRAVQKMIEAGRLEARKVGRDYLIAPLTCVGEHHEASSGQAAKVLRLSPKRQPQGTLARKARPLQAGRKVARI